MISLYVLYVCGRRIGRQDEDDEGIRMGGRMTNE